MPTTPYLSYDLFAHEDVAALNPPQLTTKAVIETGKASLRISVEAARQVVESRPRNQSVIEDTESLREILRVLMRSRAYFTTIREHQPELLTEVVQEVMRRRGESESDPLDWASDKFDRATSRLKRVIQSIEDYNR